MAELIGQIQITEIVEILKAMQTTKMYDKEGKWCSVKVIEKQDFLEVCQKCKSQGLSEGVISVIEPLVCLSDS